MSKMRLAITGLTDKISALNSDRQAFLQVVIVALFVTVLSGCELVGDLLKLGFWTGVIIVVIIVVLIMAVMRFFRRRV